MDYGGYIELSDSSAGLLTQAKYLARKMGLNSRSESGIPDTHLCSRTPPTQLLSSLQLCLSVLPPIKS